jgi:hypothetical protein
MPHKLTYLLLFNILIVLNFENITVVEIKHDVKEHVIHHSTARPLMILMLLIEMQAPSLVSLSLVGHNRPAAVGLGSHLGISRHKFPSVTLIVLLCVHFKDLRHIGLSEIAKISRRRASTPILRGRIRRGDGSQQGNIYHSNPSIAGLH